MESKAYLINGVVEKGKWLKKLEDSLLSIFSAMAQGDEELLGEMIDSLPKGWRSAVTEAAKASMDEVYTHEEVEYMYNQYDTAIGRSVADKYGVMNKTVEAKIELIVSQAS